MPLRSAAASWCQQHELALFAARRVGIECFARDLEARGRARATITRRLYIVAGFCRYAVEEVSWTVAFRETALPNLARLRREDKDLFIRTSQAMALLANRPLSRGCGRVGCQRRLPVARSLT